MCEIIGRVQADPDFIPRNDDFGLNRELFYKTFCQKESDHCPEVFYRIAFLCCNLNPDKRPSFKFLQEWFDRICVHCAILGSFHSQLPPDLLAEIYNFHGEDSSPEIQVLKGPLAGTSSVDVVDSIEKNCVASNCLDSSEIDQSPIQPTTLLRNLSPHLAKDFNANGERIRDSLRARRKQKIRENRQRIKKENGIASANFK